MPVRLILDDFATNACIPDFDKIISVIRSREISVSIILQSISQLDSVYGHSASMTIINNCDNCLYLGGQDVETARYIAAKANKTADTILNMPLDQAAPIRTTPLWRRTPRLPAPGCAAPFGSPPRCRRSRRGTGASPTRNDTPPDRHSVSKIQTTSFKNERSISTMKIQHYNHKTAKSVPVKGGEHDGH